MSEHGESALGRSRPWRGCQGQDDLSCPGATHTEERGGPRAAVARSLGNWVGVGPYGRDLETEQRREVSLGSELCLEVAWDTAGPRVASPRARHHHVQAACGAHGGICGGLDGSPAGTCCSRPGQIPKAGSPPLHAFFLVSLWGALSPPPHRSPSSEGPRLLFFLSFPRRSSIFQENDSPRDEKLEGSAGTRSYWVKAGGHWGQHPEPGRRWERSVWRKKGLAVAHGTTRSTRREHSPRKACSPGNGCPPCASVSPVCFLGRSSVSFCSPQLSPGSGRPRHRSVAQRRNPSNAVALSRLPGEWLNRGLL